MARSAQKGKADDGYHLEFYFIEPTSSSVAHPQVAIMGLGFGAEFVQIHQRPPNAERRRVSRIAR